MTNKFYIININNSILHSSYFIHIYVFGWSDNSHPGICHPDIQLTTLEISYLDFANPGHLPSIIGNRSKSLSQKASRKYVVDANLFRLWSTNPKKKSQTLDAVWWGAKLPTKKKEFFFSDSYFSSYGHFCTPIFDTFFTITRKIKIEHFFYYFFKIDQCWRAGGGLSASP